MVTMKKQALFIIVLSFLCAVVYSQNTKDDKNKYKDSYLLFELGIVYPELEFIDSKAQQSLNSDLTNVSSNRIAIGGGGPIINRLGYLLTLSSNRYDLRTYYTESNFDNYVHYTFDYLALDGGLTFRFLKPTVKWLLFLKVGASYNYLLSGFQEMNNLTVDLKKNEDYTNEHIDLNLGLNLRRKLGRFSHFWLGYNYKLSFWKESKTNFSVLSFLPF
jgi:hypothetical protein